MKASKGIWPLIPGTMLYIIGSQQYKDTLASADFYDTGDIALFFFVFIIIGMCLMIGSTVFIVAALVQRKGNAPAAGSAALALGICLLIVNTYVLPNYPEMVGTPSASVAWSRVAGSDFSLGRDVEFIGTVDSVEQDPYFGTGLGIMEVRGFDAPIYFMGEQEIYDGDLVRVSGKLYAITFMGNTLRLVANDFNFVTNIPDPASVSLAPEGTLVLTDILMIVGILLIIIGSVTIVVAYVIKRKQSRKQRPNPPREQQYRVADGQQHYKQPSPDAGSWTLPKDEEDLPPPPQGWKG
jgi:hypothetical protein